MHVSEMSIATFYQENVSLNIWYSQQFTGELTDSSAAVSVTCQKEDVERKKMLFQPSLMWDMTAEATCFSLWITYVTR